MINRVGFYQVLFPQNKNSLNSSAAMLLCMKYHDHIAKSTETTLQCKSLPQIAKLLIIPFVCLVERLWLQRRFSKPVMASVLVVVLGVAIV